VRVESVMKTTIRPPQLPRDAASFAVGLPEGRLRGNRRYENLILADGDCSEQSAARVTFDECRFERTKFCGAQLPGLTVSDVVFEECDVANAVWTGVTLTRVEMSGCRLLGLRANEADIQHLVVRRGTASLAQFRFAIFQAVRFEECNLRGVDFQGADLRGVIFQGCDLREAQMSGAKLLNTDFRSSEIDGMQIGPADLGNLKGAIVEPVQAAYIAGQLGLHVKWDGADK
jgi:uncharacterized protein YjbI with pentapeptide repeats